MSLIRDAYQIITNSGEQGSTTANNILHKAPLSLPYAGLINYVNGSTGGQGNDTQYWSAGATSDYSSSYLTFSGTATRPDRSYYRSYGCSVRCVSK